MNDNMFRVFKTFADTSKLVDEAEEAKKAEFKRLEQHYYTGQDQSYKKADGTKVHQYRHGVMTDIGNIEVTEWIKLAFELIDKYNERDIFDELNKNYTIKRHTEKHIIDFNLVNALSLHISRIFERPQWVDYEKFKKEYLDTRDQMLLK